MTFAAVVRGEPPTRSPNNKISSSFVMPETHLRTLSAYTVELMPFSRLVERISSRPSPTSMVSALCRPGANFPWLTKTTYFIFSSPFLFCPSFQNLNGCLKGISCFSFFFFCSLNFKYSIKKRRHMFILHMSSFLHYISHKIL